MKLLFILAQLFQFNIIPIIWHYFHSHNLYFSISFLFCLFRDPLDGTKYGILQKAEGDQSQETALRIREMDKYMLEEVFTDSQYAGVRHDCKNRHELCAYW